MLLDVCFLRIDDTVRNPLSFEHFISLENYLLSHCHIVELITTLKLSFEKYL